MNIDIIAKVLYVILFILSTEKGSGVPLPLKAFGLSVFASAALIEGGVAGVEVLGVEVILGDSEGIGEALIMHDLALAKESDDVADVGIIREAKDIVVGGSRLLLGGEVLVEIGQNIALYADVFHIKRNARCGYGVRARGMIHEIRREGSAVYLLEREIFGQLMDYRRHHLKMRELFGAYVGKDSRDLLIGAGISLMQVAHRCAELTVGAAELRNNDARKLGVGVLYLYGVLKLLIIGPHSISPFLSNVGFVFPGPRGISPVPLVRVVAHCRHRHAHRVKLCEKFVALGKELLVIRHSRLTLGVCVKVEDGVNECELYLLKSLLKHFRASVILGSTSVAAARAVAGAGIISSVSVHTVVHCIRPPFSSLLPWKSRSSSLKIVPCL